MDPAGLRPLGIGEILDVAIKIYRARFVVLIKAVAIVLGPVFALAAIIRISIPTGNDLVDPTQPGATPEFDADQFWAFVAGTLLIVFVSFVASQLATGACFKAVSGAYLDEEADWRESLRFARAHLRSLLWLSLVLVVLLSLGLIACVAPAVYFYVAWTVAAPVLLLEGIRGKGALKRSRQLVKGRWWPTLAVVLLVALIQGVVQGVFLGIFGIVSLSGNDVAGAVADFIGQTVSSALTTPLSAAVLTVLYFDLRVRKEGFDLELLARRLGVEPGPAAFFEPPPPPFRRPDDAPSTWPPPPEWKPGDE